MDINQHCILAGPNADLVMSADSAARYFFDKVANKWSVMILTVLAQRPTRFNELRRRLDSVSHKALTQALRRLERNGLVSREVQCLSPIIVQYSLTELGRSVNEPLGAAFDWVEKHALELSQAQRSYDNMHMRAKPLVS